MQGIPNPDGRFDYSHRYPPKSINLSIFKWKPQMHFETLAMFVHVTLFKRCTMYTLYKVSGKFLTESLCSICVDYQPLTSNQTITQLIHWLSNAHELQQKVIFRLSTLDLPRFDFYQSSVDSSSDCQMSAEVLHWFSIGFVRESVELSLWSWQV